MYKRFQAILLINPCQFLVLIVLLLLGYSSGHAQQTDTLLVVILQDSTEYHMLTEELQTSKMQHIKPAKRESKRVVAALLCMALGPFGIHRLYLGTEPQVPAAYSITLG